MLGRAALVPRHTSRLPRPGNEKALQRNGFLICAARVQRHTSRDARSRCPGITNDTRFARQGNTAGQTGFSKKSHPSRFRYEFSLPINTAEWSQP